MRETVNFLGDVGLADFLFGTKWTPQLGGDQQSFGVVPLVVGDAVPDGASRLLVAIPLGLLSAIYLSEYASPRVRRIVKPILEVLAGVPTIVFGFFALTFVTPEILQRRLRPRGEHRSTSSRPASSSASWSCRRSRRSPRTR